MNLTSEHAFERIAQARVGCFVEPITLEYLRALRGWLRTWLTATDAEIDRVMRREAAKGRS